MSSSRVKHGSVRCYLAFVSGKLLIGLLLLALAGALPATAATITVTNTNDSGAGSLRQAIADANPLGGDTIDFSVTGTILLTTGELGINKNLTITGPGSSSLTVSGNFASRIFAIGFMKTVNISGLTVRDGVASHGAAIYNIGILTLTSTIVSDNVAGLLGGGGIYTSSGTNSGDTLTLIDSMVIGNRTGANGGGIFNGSFGTVNVINSVVSNNRSTGGGGGGIYNNDSSTRLTVTDSTISGNSAIFGGGITNGGTLTVIGSTISGNSASGGGGIANGLGVSFGGVATLTNATVSNNSAVTFGGGGIYNIAGTLAVTHSTIYSNAGGSNGGGIFNPGPGSLSIKNTVVATSVSGGNCAGAGAAASHGHNLSSDGTCVGFLTQIGDLNSTPAGLDPLGLQNNGGPTQTIALVAGSPALDAIPTSPTNYCTAIDGTTPIATDQRGVARPQSSACDIGAFELVQDDAGPITTNVQASPSPVAINTAVTLTANVDDTATGGSNIASAQYTIDGGPPIPMDAADAAFDEVSEDVTASVAPFVETGVYSLCVNGTDVPGNVGGPECTLLPVYDPSAGFVTGGGFVNSPENADLDNPSAAGPARFGFVSKYLPGRSIPDGNLEFQFQAGNLNFKSTSMDWLVVTGEPRGQFQGTGTINGTTVCKFAVDAWDASFAPGGVDAFGLRIFACAGGGDRYSLPPTPLTKGSIIIHRQ